MWHDAIAILALTATAFAGGFFMRLRGMDLGLSTTINRLAIAALLALTGLVWGLPWQFALPLAPLAFLAHVTGWGAHQRMHPDVYGQAFGHTELLTFWLPGVFGRWDDAWPDRRKTLYQVAGMASIGLIRHAVMALAVLPFSILAGVLFIAAALLYGPVYWLGWQVNRLWGLDWHETWAAWADRPLLRHLRSGGEWGEIFVGITMFGALAGALSFCG